MIIKELLIQNFQCYNGKQEIEFKEGLNVFIGDNGSGKSKLYDAFYWVLYDQIFDSSSRSFLKTSIIGDQVISDKAKNECATGEKVEASVRIITESHNVNYIIKRSFSSVKISNQEFSSNKDSQIEIVRESASSRTFVDRGEIESTLERILPISIKPYLWFQGEQVDSLIDFNDKNTLTKAVDVLSNISTYDSLVSIARKSKTTAENAYNKERRRHIKNKGIFDDDLAVKEGHEKNIELKNKELSTYKDQLFEAEKSKDRLLSNIDDAKNIAEINGSLRSITAQLDETKRHFIQESLALNKNIFRKGWVLKKADKLLDSFEKKIQTYTEKHEEEIKKSAENELKDKFRLPINVPEPIYLEQMIKKERCLVCDREAPRDSTAFNKIKQLIERTHEQSSKIIKDKPTSVRNIFNAEINALYHNSLRERGRISSIEQDINEHIERVDDLRNKWSFLESEEKNLNDQLGNLLNDSTLRDADQARNLTIEFNKLLSQIRKLQEDISRTEGVINNLISKKVEVEKKLRDQHTSSFDPQFEKRYIVLSDFHKIAVETRERVYESMIKKLEEAANLHYHAMTKDNQSIQGRIILERQPNGNYMPKNIDKDGDELTSINDSNIILIKLAVIMAIISSKNGDLEQYPMISDAPTSKFSDNYTIGFCQTISKVFKQSIIMSYDFYHNMELRKRLLKDVQNLGNVFLIEPNLDENDRMDRSKLEVKIQTIQHG